MISTLEKDIEEESPAVFERVASPKIAIDYDDEEEPVLRS